MVSVTTKRKFQYRVKSVVKPNRPDYELYKLVGRARRKTETLGAMADWDDRKSSKQVQGLNVSLSQLLGELHPLREAFPSSGFSRPSLLTHCLLCLEPSVLLSSHWIISLWFVIWQSSG